MKWSLLLDHGSQDYRIIFSVTYFLNSFKRHILSLSLSLTYVCKYYICMYVYVCVSRNNDYSNIVT